MTKEKRTYNGKIGSYFSKWFWESWKATCKRMKLKDFPTFTKINSKWTLDLNLRQEIIKLLKENICRTPSNINCSNIYF